MMNITMMFVSLKYLNLNKENLNGKLKVIFQPAEEEVGGAKAMIEQRPDFFKDLTHVFGFHIWNQIELEKIAFNDNTVFVSADTFEIEALKVVWCYAALKCRSNFYSSKFNNFGAINNK